MNKKKEEEMSSFPSRGHYVKRIGNALSNDVNDFILWSKDWSITDNKGFRVELSVIETEDGLKFLDKPDSSYEEIVGTLSSAYKNYQLGISLELDGNVPGERYRLYLRDWKTKKQYSLVLLSWEDREKPFPRLVYPVLALLDIPKGNAFVMDFSSPLMHSTRQKPFITYRCMPDKPGFRLPVYPNQTWIWYQGKIQNNGNCLQGMSDLNLVYGYGNLRSQKVVSFQSLKLGDFEEDDIARLDMVFQGGLTLSLLSKLTIDEIRSIISSGDNGNDDKDDDSGTDDILPPTDNTGDDPDSEQDDLRIDYSALLWGGAALLILFIQLRLFMK